MKLIRRMLLCVLLVAVACVCVGCSVYREPVALLPGIEFGMNPAEVEDVLGEPDEVEQVAGMNGKTHTVLIYEDVPVGYFFAQLRLTFRPFGFGTVLEKCVACIVNKGGVTNPAVGLYQWVTPSGWRDELDELLRDQLCGKNGFIRTDMEEDGIVYEKSGTTYSLQMTDDGRDVQLLAECDEYYR